MIRTAVVATAFLLTTTLAAPAASTDHWKRPGIDAMTTHGIGDSTSPGDPFYPPVNAGKASPRGNVGAYTLSCKVVVGADGTATFIFENVGSSSIPMYFVIEADTPHGDYSVLATPVIEPGEVLTMKTSSDEYGPPGSEYDCTAKVKIGTEPKPVDDDEDVPK
jgi:hypothetical protein